MMIDPLVVDCSDDRQLRNARLYTLAKLLMIAAVLIALTVVLMSAGCMTLAKNTYRDLTQTPVPTEQPDCSINGCYALSTGELVTIPDGMVLDSTGRPIPKPTATPTPIPTNPESYQHWKYRLNQYNLSEWYTFSKDNVIAQRNITVRTTVYRTKFLKVFSQHGYRWGTDSWWQYIPADGNKYLFVWVCQYMEDGGTSIYGLDESHVVVQIDQKIYKPITTSTEIYEPIRELETAYTLDKSLISPAYGYSHLGNESNKQYYLYPGRSNSWDGYILYEIPAETKDKDIKIVINFNHMAPMAFWAITKGGDYSSTI